MMNSLYTAATGMAAQQTSMDVIAHNLANVNTTGFKSGRLTFEDLLYQQIGSRQMARDGSQVGMGVAPARTEFMLTQGTLKVTGEVTHLAIDGAGFFQVQLPSGVGYTRDGSFAFDGLGQLVNSSGYRVMPSIQLPAGADRTSLSISPAGAVTVKVAGVTTPLGTLQLVNFTNPGGLTAAGDNVYTASANSGTASIGNPSTGGLGVLRQGSLEESNVSVMEEMVNMITAQRAFESVSKVISTSDEMLAMANQLRR